MANLSGLKSQVENANALGVNNLAKKGVNLSGSATTYDIMNAISDINIGSGLAYTSIVYNKDDDTITLTDKYGGESIMVCSYDDGRLIGVTYNGKEVDLTYALNILDYVGETRLNFADVPIYGIEPLDCTVEFRVNNSPYQIVSVKNGLSVYAPSVDPPNQGEARFNGWKVNDKFIDFPYNPYSDAIAEAYFQNVRREMELYEAGSFLAEDKQGEVFWKTKSGWSIAGYTPSNHGCITLVSDNEDACHIQDAYFKGSITYNGKVYYYCANNTTFGAVRVCNSVELPQMQYVDSKNVERTAKNVLDAYFYVI